MDRIFYPKSIVVVGVSESPKNLGRNIVENLLRFGFQGELNLVGKDGSELHGKPIYRSIDDVPGVPDLAVLLIPAKAILSCLEDCGRKGIQRAVVESGGFSEYSDDAENLERDIRQVAAKYGLRFVGPNCISVMNLDNGLVLPFVLMEPEITRKGGVSLISQSGGVLVNSVNLFSCENLGFSKFVSIGNKLNLDENDFLEYLDGDENTRIIGMYLESISNGRRLVSLAQKIRKPVVVLKSNRFPASNEVAKFHTAALAQDDRVCNAAFKQAGIHRVDTLADMITYTKVFRMPLPQGPNLGVIGRSGGQNVISADAVTSRGFQMLPFSDATLESARKRSRAGVIRMTNPLDLGDIFDLDFYVDVLESVLRDSRMHGVLLQHGYGGPEERETTYKMIESVKELSFRYQKPVILTIITSREDWFELRNASDFPVFPEAGPALEALAAALRHYRRIEGMARDN